MTPNEAMPPIRQALALLFDHPELLTLDPTQARAVEELIAGKQNPHFADVWQYISTHPLGGDDPWAVKVPITPDGARPAMGQDGDTLYQWALSPGIRAVIRQPLATALRLARGAEASGPAGAMHEPAIGSGTAWTMTGLPPRFGLAIPSFSFDAGPGTCTLLLQNLYSRHLSVYVAFFADGEIMPPPAWTSRLPPRTQDFLESASVKFLGVLPPGAAVAGMAVPTGATSLAFTLPGRATAARVMFGGLGLGGLNLLVDAAAAMLTAVLDHAVPVILDGAGVGLSKSGWFNGVLADDAIRAEIMGAARFLFGGAPPPDTQHLLQVLGANLGAMLLGDTLPLLQAAIATAVGAQAIAKAAPVLGWAEAELAAQAAQRLEAQTSTRLLSSPATFWLDLVPVVCTVSADPQHGIWPDLAAIYQVTFAYDGVIVSTEGGAIPDNNAPIEVRGPLLPAGGRAAVRASVLSASGQDCGAAEAPASFLLPADRRPQARGLTLRERVVTPDASTRYRHKRALIYDPAMAAHRWQEGAAPTAVGLVPAPGAAFRSLVGITLQERSGDVGYTWQEGDAAARYVFQNIGVIDPQARLTSSGPAFSAQPYLVYDGNGSMAAAAAGTGSNVYLDPGSYAQDGRWHLRSVVLDGHTPFNLSQAASWGAFVDLPSRLQVHPAALVVACLQNQDTLEIVALADGGVAPPEAPSAMFIVGPGSGIGQVRGPVAAAVTSDGHILVLEQDNARVQAFDAYGNAAPYFRGASPIMQLHAEAGPVRYLDLAIGPDDVLYALSYRGSAPRSQDYGLDLYGADGTFLSRTAGVAAARLTVDGWGRVYTLNYESISSPEGRTEPSISQWIPSALGQE